LAQRFKHNVLAALTLLLLLGLVWAGFGFTRVGLYEEWAIRSTMDETAPILLNLDWNGIKGYGLEQHYTRPLSFFPNTLGFLLTPDSFLGQHLVLIALLFGCGFFFYLLVLRLLPTQHRMALLAAILCMLPAADTGYLNFRLLVAVFVALCWVVATYFLIVFYQNKQRVFAVLMLVILSAGLLAYESIYPLVLCTPILLLWLGRGLKRRIILASLLWYTAPLAVVLRTLIVMMNSGSYVGSLLSENANRDLKTILTILWYSFWRVYERSLLAAWVEGLSKAWHSSYMGVALLITLVALVALYIANRRRTNASEETPTAIKHWQWLTLLVLSVGAIFVGFGLFAVIEGYSVVTDRVYILTGFGTALSLALLLQFASGWLGRRISLRAGTVCFAVGAAVLIFASTMQAIDQTQVYQRLSSILQRFLGQMVALAPELRPNTQIMVIDDTGSLSGEQFMGQEGLLTPFVRVLYQDKTLFASICSPLKLYGDPLGTCVFKNDMFGIEGDSAIPLFMNTMHSDQDLLLFRYGSDRNLKLLSAISGDGSAASYHPEAHILNAPPPLRARILFACLPIKPCTDSITPPFVTAFHTDYTFRDEISRHGLGWFKPEKHVIGGVTLAWNNAYQSILHVRLQPNQSYRFRARIVDTRLTDPSKEMMLKVNGSLVALDWKLASDGTFTLQGHIPSTLIDPQQFDTQFEFEYAKLAPINGNKPTFLGSVAFDYLDVAPE
jgi:hypothetical protein